jgi:hypothetical protein
MAASILSQKNIRQFKKLLKSTGRESFNLAITKSANQPIKGGMLELIAMQTLSAINVQKNSALAGAEGMATTAYPRAGRFSDRPAKAYQHRCESC